MTNRLRFISIIAALLTWVPAIAAAQSIQQGFYYKLGTQFRGEGMKLAVFNGGPRDNLTRLVPDQNVTLQFWRLARTTDGWFLLSTQFRGSNVCLDIFNGGPNDNEPHLAPCENLTGQHWKIAGEDGAVRLTTEFRGPDMCLDIFNGGPNKNQPHLTKCGNLPGQAWTLTRTDTPVEGYGVDNKPVQAPARPSPCKRNEVYSSSMGQCIPKELGR
jgi:Ricin-type beta-trefoil lectin domain